MLAICASRPTPSDPLRGPPPLEGRLYASLGSLLPFGSRLFLLNQCFAGAVDIACAHGQDDVALLDIGLQELSDGGQGLAVGGTGMRSTRSREEMPMRFCSRAA